MLWRLFGGFVFFVEPMNSRQSMPPNSSPSRDRYVFGEKGFAMSRYFDHRHFHYFLLVAVASVLFLLNLGGPSLWDVDEGRNLTAVLEMRESGDWIVPTFNGQLRDHKPALLYWLQVAAIHFFGVNEFAARLPSALAALVTVLLTYELGRSLFGKSTGLLGGLIVASTIMLGAAAHFANPDALLNLFTVLAFCVFWWGWQHSGRVPYAACGLACGLAFLAKGPVGLLLPAAAFFLFLLWVRSLRAYLTPRLLLGVVTFCVVALPWYILVGVETKAEFLRGFFLQHNMDRAVNSMENHSGGLWYYLLVLLVGFAPWSAFLGLTLWYSFWSAIRCPWNLHHWWTLARDTKQQQGYETLVAVSPLPTPHSPLPTPDSPASDRYRFLWCWLAIYFVFFTLAATKLPNYILPMSTPLALLTARMLERWRAGKLMAPGWLMRLGLAGFGLVGVVATAGILLAGGMIPLPRIELQSLIGSEYLAAVGVVPIAGALAAWQLARRQRRTAALASLGVAGVLFLAPLFAWAGQIVEQLKPARSLVAEAHALQRTRDLLIVNYNVEYLASLHFYCQRGVDYCSSDAQVLDRLRSLRQVYLFLPAADWSRLSGHAPSSCRVLARHRDLHQHIGEVVVVTNQPRD
jgi:4-amino-4-deoxy-L-arabinose transferase-like glycosyltransferase